MAEAKDTQPAPERPARGGERGRVRFLRSGLAQFGGQALGLAIALLVSHLIARRMGIGPDAEAFILGRRLITAVTEALSQIIVVVVIPLVAAQAAAGMSLGRVLARSAGPALVGGIVLAVLFAATAPWLVMALAPSLSAPTAALAADVVAIFALSMPAIAVTIALAGHCNVHGWFGTPAALRQLPRAAVGLALALGTGALALKAAWAYSVASFGVALLLLALVIGLARGAATGAGTAPPRSAAVRRRGAAAVVLTLGALANIWLETAYAARLDAGGIAMLDYSQRLGALLANTLAMAIGLVAFTDMARRSAEGDGAGVANRFLIALGAGLALIAPVQIGLWVNARAVVDLVYAYGAFTSEAAERVAGLLRWIVLAPFSGLFVRLLLVRLLADQGLPMLRLVVGATVADFAARVVLFWLLTPALGLTAIPVTLVIAPVVPVCILGFGLWARKAFTGHDRGAVLAAVGPLFAVSAAGCLGLVSGAWIGGLLAPAGDVGKQADLVQLVLSGTVGLLAFGLAAAALRRRLRP